MTQTIDTLRADVRQLVRDRHDLKACYDLYTHEEYLAVDARLRAEIAELVARVESLRQGV